MKRNSICYLLAIIAMLTAFNVNAASEQLKGWSYCSTNKGSFNTKYSNGTSYEYHEQYV